MKVGILTSSISRRAGGLFESVRLLSQSLCADLHCQIQVFALRDDYTDQDENAWDMLPLKVFPTFGPNSLGYAPGLFRELRSVHLDILHAHGIWMLPSAASAGWSKNQKKPNVISPRGMLDSWAVQNSVWKKRIAGWLYENAHLRRAACLHALCKAEVDAIHSYGLKNPICLIPNGVKIPQETISSLPSWKDNVPAGSKVLLYLGRLHPKKGLANLLQAWNAARKKEPRNAENWYLVVAGWDQNGHENELRALCAKLCIENSVRFVGPQFAIDKCKTYFAADAFILPSFSEGLPMAVLEAWSYRLPVLMTSQCNLPEGFRAEAALQIEPESNSISCTLIELFVMADSERAAIGGRGCRLVETNFSWQKIAADMYSVYEWVVGGGSRPNCIID